MKQYSCFLFPENVGYEEAIRKMYVFGFCYRLPGSFACKNILHESLQYITWIFTHFHKFWLHVAVMMIA